MEVYGIAGGNRSGKSTLAEYLRETAERSHHIEYSDAIREVANRWLETLPEIPCDTSESELIRTANVWMIELPQAIYEIIGIHSQVDDFYIDPDNTHRYESMHGKLIDYLTRFSNGKAVECIEPENKYEHVEILQWLGFSTREFIGSHIWPEAVERKIKEHSESDSELLTIGGVRYEHDAIFVRSLGGYIVKVLRTEADCLHEYSTESAYKNWEADATILNDGTLEQLRSAARHVRDYSHDKEHVSINTRDLQ